MVMEAQAQSSVDWEARNRREANYSFADEVNNNIQKNPTQKMCQN